MAECQESEEARSESRQDSDRAGLQMTGVEPEVILEIGRPKAVGVWGARRSVAPGTHERTAIGRCTCVRTAHRSVGGRSRTRPEGNREACRWSQARRITLIEHPQQMADRCAARVEAPREGSRARAVPEMLVEELASRRSGDEVGGHDRVPRAQPVAVMLRPAHELVDEAHRIAGAKQIVGELVEDGTERVGPESADMMRSVKECV